MKQNIVALSINSSWNIVNFRQGLIAGLQRRGYRVVALAPRDAYSERLAALDVEFVPIEIDNHGMSPFRDLVLMWRYYRALRRLRPDVLLAFTVKPNVYGSIVARILRIPVINNIAGLGTAFIREGLLTRIVSALYTFALRRSATIFFQNSDDSALFVGKGIVRAGQVRLLPGSGVDLAKFVPSEQATDHPHITFLLVARLLWDKGVGEYVEAARLVRAQVPNARFQILGFLDVENRTAISRAQVCEWVGEGVIEYLGESDDVRPFIAAADCIVLPSYREGMPRVLLEGAAMGKPLVATDVPGCRQAIDHGVNGYLCEVRSASSLADAMLKIARAEPEQRRAMGQAGRAFVQTHYDERSVIDHYIGALDAALPDRG